MAKANESKQVHYDWSCTATVSKVLVCRKQEAMLRSVTVAVKPLCATLVRRTEGTVAHCSEDRPTMARAIREPEAEGLTG